MQFYRAIVEIDKNLTRTATKEVLNQEIDKLATVWIDDGWHSFAWNHSNDIIIDGEEISLFRQSIIIACDNPAKSLEIPEAALSKALDYWEVGYIHSQKIHDASFVNDIGLGSSIPSTFAKRGNFVEIRNIPPSSEFWDDWIIHSIDSKSNCLLQAKSTIHKNNLSSEIQNIYKAQNSKNKDVSIPVHYILEGSTSSKIRESIDCLANALVGTNRTKSKHVIWLNLDCDTRFSKWHDDFRDLNNENFAHVLDGNIVVIDYGREDTGSRYDIDSYRAFVNLISNLNSFIDNTQLLFVIPDGKPFIRNKIEKILKLPVVYIANEHYRSVDKKQDQINLNNVTEAIQHTYPQYMENLDRAKTINDQKLPSSMEQLDSLIGLKEVKIKIKEILNRYKMNEILKDKGLQNQSFNMNMAFMGSPGTGKTIVARLVGEILKEAGVLTEGRVIEVSGAGRWDAEKIFEAAKGSVLFVDEAYAMIKDPNNIASFVALMEANREDTVVIIGGYESDIKMLLSSNVGFASRFSNMIYFNDYSESELLEIFDFMLKQQGLVAEENARKQVREILCRAGRRPDQGNARFVRQLVEDCVGQQQNRLAAKYANEDGVTPNKNTLTKLTAKDIPNKYVKLTDKSAGDDFKKLVGLKTVKERVLERINYCAVQSARRDFNMESEFIPMHMAFLGSPGTGKTEVAKILGRLLNEKGLLSVGDFFPVNGSIIASLKPEFLNAYFQQARGSVLFIDEAYSMIQNPVNVGLFIDKMDEYRNEIVVILAGYTKEINALFASNPGFESRVKNIINFPDYTLDELVKIAELLLTKDGYTYNKKVVEKIRANCKKVMKKPNFGNGRYIRNLIENSYIKQGNRIAPRIDKLNDKEKKKALQTIQPEDIIDDFTNDTHSGQSQNIGFVKE